MFALKLRNLRKRQLICIGKTPRPVTLPNDRHRFGPRAYLNTIQNPGHN